MIRWAAVLAILLITSRQPAPAAVKAGEGEWPQWLGPNHDGKSPDTGLLKAWPADGPKLLWKVNTLGVGYGTPGRRGRAGLRLRRRARQVQHLRLRPQRQTGREDRARDVLRRRPRRARNTPAIDEGNVYVMGGTGLLACYDAKSGEKKWQHDMREFGGSPGGWGYAESPLVYGNLVIVKPGGKNCIVALRQEDRQRRLVEHRLLRRARIRLVHPRQPQGR